MDSRSQSGACPRLYRAAGALAGSGFSRPLLCVATTCGLLATIACRSYEPERLAFASIVEGARPASGDAPGSTGVAYRTFFDARAWSEFWQGSFAEAVPPVRFEEEFVLCLELGTKPSGGYGVEVRDVEFEARTGELQVILELLEPGADEMVIQILTAPYSMVRVRAPRAAFDRRPPPIRFRRQVGSERRPIEGRCLDTGASEPR